MFHPLILCFGRLKTKVGGNWQDVFLMLLARNQGLKEKYKSEDVAMHDVVWLVKQYVKGMGRPGAGCFWDVKRCNGYVKVVRLAQVRAQKKNHRRRIVLVRLRKVDKRGRPYRGWACSRVAGQVNGKLLP